MLSRQTMGHVLTLCCWIDFAGFPAFYSKIKATTTNPHPLDFDTKTSEFKIDKLVVKLTFNRAKLSELRAQSMCAVTVKPENPIVLYGKSYPFIVFPARITPTLDLEQTGEGFPCANESQANNISKAIQGKNQTVPHVGMFSVPGYFGIGTIKDDFYQERIVVFKFHVPKIINGRRCGFALRLALSERPRLRHKPRTGHLLAHPSGQSRRSGSVQQTRQPPKMNLLSRRKRRASGQNANSG